MNRYITVYMQLINEAAIGNPNINGNINGNIDEGALSKWCI